MDENLVIVESPAKAKTIEKFLGKDFAVMSSYGHIRDLAKKDFGVDVKNNYKPEYIIAPDKKKIVAELKKMVKNVKSVWLASDEDREGESIAWHLAEVLNLDQENTKRIVFHEITQEAILNSIKNPRKIDKNLVDAQQARRVLDRLVGFELSPVLWKKVKPALSAGRVQSVAVRLLVEREREIMGFTSESSYRVYGYFAIPGSKEILKAELSHRLKTKAEALELLEQCKIADFVVSKVEKRPSKKSPSPPFTTSTLQQEASRKLGFSVSRTMIIAQKLYEAGFITYMRTDSVNLSKTALDGTKQMIVNEFGEKYSNSRQYTTKSKSAQEAHEAIRPTYISNKSVNSGRDENRLYELIWKRTIASQMSDAQIEKTTVTINISNNQEIFTAVGEVLKFDGFLKVYIESSDDEKEESAKGLLPPIKESESLTLKKGEATERFTHHPPRYTEASLVKKLEELGIGRPSTYAPTISTIQNRGYVIKEDRPGVTREYNVLLLNNGKIKDTANTEITGTEKGKLFPKDIGMVVNDYLLDNFDKIMNYDFTATVEKQFDEIASGKLNWTEMIDRFYKTFHTKVEEALEKKERKTGERILGKDPKTDKQVSVRIGRYGPMVQLGESDSEEKPQYAGLRKDQLIETITLEEALELFKLPRKIGAFEEKEIVAAIGRFGPYLRHDSKFYSIKADVDDPLTISLERSIEVIKEKREKDKQKEIKLFDHDPDLKILDGRWGPYISYKKKNYRIPKKQKPEELSYEDCIELINKPGEKKGKKKNN